MSDLSALLQLRCQEARARLDSAREAATTAERELCKWQDALELELQQNGNGKIVAEKLAEIAEYKVRLGSNGARTKREIVVNVFRESGVLRPSELLKKVQPVVSQSYLFYVLDELKNSGHLKKEGRNIRYVEISEEPKR